MARGSEKTGCLNCYAARMASRNLPGLKSPTTGKPFARIFDSGPRWTGDVELIESQLLLPLKWKQPRRIFVDSMSDLFHEELPDEAIDRVFAVMALCPQHTFQVLTKRPERMLVWFDSFRFAYDRGEVCADWMMRAGFTAEQIEVVVASRFWTGLSNVWLGVSIENQATAEARIPLLLRTPAAIRFVSYEPALEPVDFNAWLRRGIDWLIIGGESGPGARPFDVQWAERTIEQCKAAGVACFTKQMGAVPMLPINGPLSHCEGFDWPEGTRFSNRTGDRQYNGRQVLLMDRKGGNWEEWPEELRIREFPI
jgi:protein gp37